MENFNLNVADLVQAIRKKIQEEPLKHTRVVKLEDLTEENLYEDSVDSKGVPILKRIEKYPDLPENVFVPVEYALKNGITPSEKYWINKKGEVKNIETGHVLKPYKGNNGYYFIGLYKIKVLLHRLVAFTFLINPDNSIYSAVNHKDHNTSNNHLSNLEWVTICENNNRENGKISKISDDKLMQYIALNDDGSEAFRITRKDNKGYCADAITTSIRSGYKYKGYYWKKSRLNKKEKLLSLLNYTGNLNDYKWIKHPLYEDLFVCREGFVSRYGRIIGSIDKYGYNYKY